MYVPENLVLGELSVEMTVVVKGPSGGEGKVIISLEAAKVKGKTVAEIGSFIQRNSYEAYQIALQELFA